MDDLTGQQFGAYRIVAPLGQGGMAAVYKAYQPTVDRYVAIKVLRQHLAADTQFLSRFRHEAKIVAQLQHPHILPIFDFGETGGYAFLAMAYLPGGTLADRLTGSPLPLAFVEHVLSQVCAALDYAHSKGIVHRDIKPSNILIDEVGNCLVADFGIAHLAGDLTRLTMPGALMGTPAYMSPEQASGETAGPQSDLYSMGIILYEMLAGRVPFQADTPIALAIKHVNAPLPTPRTLNPLITPPLEAVVMKALARAGADRFNSGAELASALGRAIRTPAEVRSPDEVIVPRASAEGDGERRVKPRSAEPPPAAPQPGRQETLRRYRIASVVGLVAFLVGALAIGMRWSKVGPPARNGGTSQDAAGTTVAALPPPPGDRVSPSAGVRDPAQPSRAETRGTVPRTVPPSRGTAAAAGAGSDSNASNSLAVSLEKTCDGGNARACVELADLYADGRRVAKDEPRAATLYDRACQKDLAASCYTLALLYRDGRGVLKNEVKAAELLQRSCDGGVRVSCNDLGQAFTFGRGVIKDDARAATYYQRACDAGGPVACDNLGLAYGRGAGVAKDEAKALTLFQKSCDGGRGSGCAHLAFAYEASRGTTKDDHHAASLYQRACDSGFPAGCSSLGLMYARGAGVDKDDRHAAALFERACQGGDRGGCNELGRAYAFGLGVASDLPKAVQLFQQACDAGNLLGCVNLGMRYMSGQGIAQDEARAVPLFVRACEGNSPPGCFQAGRAYGLGQGGVTKDQARATSYFERACSGGSGPGCMALANRYRNGAPPLAKDEAQAAKLFERACDLRVADGCSSLANAYQLGRGVEKNAARAADLYRRAQGLSGTDARTAAAIADGGIANETNGDPTSTGSSPATGGSRDATSLDDTGWMSSVQYHDAFTKRQAHGFYPARVEGRASGGRDEFRADWLPWSAPCQWYSYHGLFKQAFDQYAARYAAQGYVLASTMQFVDALGTSRYQGTWTKNCATPAVAGGVASGAGRGASPAPPPPPAPVAPVRVGGAVKEPARIKYVKPVYPAAAQSARVQGVIIVDVTIGIDGNVTSARIVRSIPMLDAAALDAVKQWQYAPTTLNGAPVPVLITVTVNFTLQ